MRAEHIEMFTAHAVSPFTDQLLILIILDHFCATPWALQYLEFIVPFLFVTDIIIVADLSKLVQMEICILVLVRDMCTANPQTDRDWIFSERICRISMTFLGTILANVLTGTNQGGGTGKLLCR